MKTKPFHSYQQSDFDLSRDLVGFGVWWEMGLGKGKLLIDTVCHLYTNGLIEALLVVAPNGVHSNLVTQEMPVHCWDQVLWTGLVYHSGRAHLKQTKQRIEELMTDQHKLRVLVMSYDGIKTKAGLALATEFTCKFKTLMALDESTAIADPESKQSKACHQVGSLAKYRRVMSGTPVAEGPLKIFNQMRFLHKDFWKKHGLTSFFAFRNTFAVYEQKRAAQGHQYQAFLYYRNLDMLNKLIAPASSRVLKEDVLDLPPKVYSRVEFDLDDKQWRMYEDLVDSLRTMVDEEHMVSATSALVRLTRLQQLTSGFAVSEEMPPLAVGEPILWVSEVDGAERSGEIVTVNETTVCVKAQVEDTWINEEIHPDRMIRLVHGDPKTIDIMPAKDNPRLRALAAILEPVTHKVIIWARFTKDIQFICDMLGDRCVRYDGSVKQGDRETALSRFRTDPSIQYFVANPAAISMGVTLTQAKTVIYYSNTFRLEQRLQSEDRAHRIGQDQKVHIVDLVASGTVDVHIVETLRKKFDIAATVIGDRLRDWLK